MDRNKALKETHRLLKLEGYFSCVWNYWDLEIEEGNKLFNKISDKNSQRLPKEFSIKHATRCWSAKKYNKEKNGRVKF